MVELGKSKLPLEEDLIKKPIEFVKSWVEWAATNALQKIISGESTLTQGAITLYTVPDNRTLYITSAFFTLAVLNGNTGFGNSIGLQITTGGGNVAILNVAASTTSAAEDVSLVSNNSVSYPMPLEVNSGSVVRILKVQGNNKQHASAGFQGFEIDKRIS